MRIEIQLVQSRPSTPNYYLFSALERAIKQYPEFELKNSGIAGKIIPIKSEFTLFFGGEEINTPLLAPISSLSKFNVCWFTEDPYELWRNLAVQHHFDKVFTSHHKSARYYKSGEYLPLAAELIEETTPSSARFDGFFFGSLWPNRLDFMQKILDLKLHKRYRFLFLLSQTEQKWNRRDHFKVVEQEFNRSGSLIRKIHRPISIDNIQSLARSSKFCFNWGRRFPGDLESVPGPRMFEIGAARVPQVLDTKLQPEITELADENTFFDLDYENCDFSQIEEILCAPEPNRTEIAAKMLNQVKSCHSWNVRVGELYESLILLK